jgi:hypothetical protein
VERETQCSLACPPMMLLLDNDVETSTNVDKNFIVDVCSENQSRMLLMSLCTLQSTGFVS